MYNPDIGKNISTLRKEKKMTQDELARKLHVTRQAISSWEISKSIPSIEIMVNIAEVLDTNIEDLLGIEKSKNKTSKRKPSKKNTLLDNLKTISIVFIVILILIILASLTVFIIKNLFS